MCSDVIGTIGVVLVTSEGRHRGVCSDIKGTIAVTSEAGRDVTGVCVVTSQKQWLWF